jgi:hypothetical protein
MHRSTSRVPIPEAAGLSQEMAARLALFLTPLLVQLDARLDVRLVRTFAATVVTGRSARSSAAHRLPRRRTPGSRARSPAAGSAGKRGDCQTCWQTSARNPDIHGADVRATSIAGAVGSLGPGTDQFADRPEILQDLSPHDSITLLLPVSTDQAV